MYYSVKKVNFLFETNENYLSVTGDKYSALYDIKNLKKLKQNNDIGKPLHSENAIQDINPKVRSSFPLDTPRENQLETIELQELIGYGGELTVYKSIIKKTKHPLTLKVINNQKKHGKNKAEINIGIKLKNKNVIKLYDIKSIKE